MIPDAISSFRSKCHPERSRAESEASRQTESKDPVLPDTSTDNEMIFRIVVRFFDEHEAELRPVSSREAAAWESPARQCRVSGRDGASPAGTPPWHESARTTQ